ncbi:hypothetical protein AURDEDRAFT_156838 [Auricularia subglabra TFB-10046 SS5]|nr:hypothetical protein AURDEDRAFT_156838 [Auricularia subglabra TFB-10046 SS5]
MRRLTAAFSRRDKSQEQLALPAPPERKRSGLFASKSARELEHIPPPGALVPPGLQTPTSSASSDASSSHLRTPDEGEDTPFTPAPQSPSRWASFLRRNKSGTVAKEAPTPKATRFPALAHPPQQSAGAGDDTDDDESEPASSDDESDDQHYHAQPPRPAIPVVVDPVFSARAQTNMRAMLQNSLDAAPSTHPLLASLGLVFPRSCNPPATLVPVPSMESVLHRTKLLQRVDSRSLSVTEQASILAFRSKTVQSKRMNNKRSIDQEAVADHKKLVGFSRGVQSWLRRPAFEERAVVWTLEPDVLGDVLRSKPVQGTGVAVAELEFSDALLALANTDAPTIPARAPPAASTGIPRKPSDSGMYRKVVLAAANARTGKVATAADDDVPLGVVLKLRREQVEKRRATEEQKRREQEEKLRVLEEQKRRQQDELERRVREEERQRKAYADEVAAARMRREHGRTGSQPRAPGAVPVTPPPMPDKRRSSSMVTPRQRVDSGKSQSRDRQSIISNSNSVYLPKSPSRTSVISHADSTRRNMTMTKADRRMSTMSESSTTSRSRDTRTLPRSFKTDSQLMPPPPLPSLGRTSSQPQLPVFVPVFIPQPVTPPWVEQYGRSSSPSSMPRSSSYMRHSTMDPRLGMSTDRLATIVPPVPRTQIQ